MSSEWHCFELKLGFLRRMDSYSKTGLSLVCIKGHLGQGALFKPCREQDSLASPQRAELPRVQLRGRDGLSPDHQSSSPRRCLQAWCAQALHHFPALHSSYSAKKGLKQTPCITVGVPKVLLFSNRVLLGILYGDKPGQCHPWWSLFCVNSPGPRAPRCSIYALFHVCLWGYFQWD